MKNINAIAEIDALNEVGRVITDINETNAEKSIPLKNTKKLLVSFSCSLINGTEKFFSKYQKLHFQLRITDENGKSNPNLVLKEYCIDMEDENLHHNTALVDFIYQRDIFIYDFNTDEIDPNKEYYLHVLIKTEEGLVSGDGWTIQSVIPANFK